MTTPAVKRRSSDAGGKHGFGNLVGLDSQAFADGEPFGPRQVFPLLGRRFEGASFTTVRQCDYCFIRFLKAWGMYYPTNGT